MQYLKRSVHSLNSKLRKIDRRAFASPPEELIGPVFLVGPPRSGSTLSYQVLVNSLNVSYLPRLANYSYGLIHLIFRTFKGQLRNPKPIFESDYGRIEGLLSPSEGFGMWQEWLQLEGGSYHRSKDLSLLTSDLASLQATIGAPLLIKCFYLSLSIDWLSRVFPDSRFIFVQREFIANCASVRRARDLPRNKHWWSVRPPGFQGHLQESVTDQVVWQVSKIIELINESFEDLESQRYRTISYEGLCEHPNDVVDDLASWLETLGIIKRSGREKLVPFRISSNVSSEMRRKIEQSKYFKFNA